ncbi:MAG TPA: cupin-like domain-containing protein [Kofleriaceae bacterium]|jgi:hypothetical protein
MADKTDEFVFPDPGVPRIPVDRIANIDSEEARRYIETSRPFVTKVDWPVTRWTPDYLREKIGQTPVALTKRNRERVQGTTSQLLDLIDNQREASKEWVMHNYPLIKLWGYGVGPMPGMKELLEEVPLPSYIRPDNTHEMYVWAKNLGWYDNKSHCEPNASASLNLQILGKKHVWLFPPEDAGRLGCAAPLEEMMGPPFFSADQQRYAPSDEHPDYADVTCYEAILEPGDIIHIPSFWFHWFVHYNTYQMNYNVWFTPPYVQMSAIAGEWAFMNGLCLALGGWGVAAEKFAELPRETQLLLNNIARTIVENPAATQIWPWIVARRDAPKIVIPESAFTKEDK